MYAVVATVRIEDVQAARDALASSRLNVVPRAPGFVAAYWLAPVDGIGTSVIVFDTREHADKAAAYPLPSAATTPMSLAGPDTTRLRRNVRFVHTVHHYHPSRVF
jgi:hypothetical protein